MLRKRPIWNLRGAMHLQVCCHWPSKSADLDDRICGAWQQFDAARSGRCVSSVPERFCGGKEGGDGAVMADGIITADSIAQLVVDKLTDKGILVPRLMSLTQAATYLGMTQQALRYKVLDGKIPAVRLDSKLRFDKEDLDRVIEAHKQVA
jgi:excisionase family DNA binding protein